ncbi:molybdenum cofactor guanylyltransferase [uncultured Modestobacter sp.]|uniref:molybdenum cofactor guanylyltransferase n=1 Tax=uncultured Modestobacter sp. TaxID=380048 RepID=UPI00262089F8|nr:NTP transferase domain-containing protein [uncultured Modestobacter sp.]
MTALPPFAAVVLAGGRAARLGGQAKPQLDVGGRSMLATVVAAVDGASPVVVVGPPQPVPDGVVLVREQPPGGGPVPALAAGLAAAGDAEVVAVLAADLPFLTPALVGALRERLDGDGVLVVDETGRDQLLLGVWRTAALRAVTASARAHAPLRGLLAPLSVQRHRPESLPGEPAPWTDCDTPAELARARAAAVRP